MKTRSILLAFFIGVIVLTILQCMQTAQEDIATPAPDFTIRFLTSPPKDLADSTASPQQLVEFAWEEFLALNWKSSYAKDGLRDHADTTWSYADEAYPDLAVWETYAHRSELRPYSDIMKPFDAPPHYSYGQPLFPYPNSNASFELFDVLDENNEIGSCDIYAHVNLYDKEYRVLYQAKVNRDEYNYVLNNYPTKEKLTAARNYTKSMIDSIHAYYPNVKNSCDVPPGYKGISLPCGSNLPGGSTGSMEVKTAWRELTPVDDASKFFTRKVVYFRGDTNKVYYDNKVYALIAIHIIHKTRNFEDFVFATWEHQDVQKDSMGYVLLNKNGDEEGKLYGGYPRLHAIPEIVKQSSDYVHAKLSTINPNSVWLNYNLVGVQSKPTNDSTSFSFFLANYVVESDSTLANFRGSGIGTPHDGKPNLLFRGKFLTMGGCQGCHGVAQKNLGADFSFLLDSNGKPIKRPDFNGDQKLRKLIQATSPRKGK
ncbi:MAG: hypothetical protein HYZ44_02790 [Bacteroidetes bacterium]|nr:hypothetical protein [Bacteroidota bacterium]